MNLLYPSLTYFHFNFLLCLYSVDILTFSLTDVELHMYLKEHFYTTCCAKISTIILNTVLLSCRGTSVK